MYFSKFYPPSVSNNNILALSDGYFSVSQIQNLNRTGVRGLFCDLIGNIEFEQDSIFTNYNIYPRRSGSVSLFNNTVYAIVDVEESYYKGGYSLLKYSDTSVYYGPLLKSQDSLKTWVRATEWLGNELVVVGTSYRWQTTPNYWLLISSVDTLGNKTWEQTYISGLNKDFIVANQVTSTKKRCLAIGGRAFDFFNLQSHVSYLLITDSIGNKINERYFTNVNHGNSTLYVKQKENGNFLVVYGKGISSNGGSFNAQGFSLTIEELDQNTLQTVWAKEYLGRDKNVLIPTDFLQQNDSTYIISGTFNPDWFGGNGYIAHQASFLFAMDENGDSLWYREYMPNWDSLHPDDKSWINDIDIAPDGGIICGGRFFTLNRPTPGNYAWMLKLDSIGCMYAGCDTVYTKPKPPITTFKVYPNPAQSSQELIIEFPNTTTATATLYNTIGQLVFKQELEFVSGVAHLSPPRVNTKGGCYFLHVQTASGKTYVEKIVFY